MITRSKHRGGFLSMPFAHFGKGVASFLYVATNGSDVNPGTLASPFATLSAALSAATSNTTIYMRGGTYYTSATITKTGLSNITVKNYPGEVPILSGGVAVGSWTATGDGTGSYSATSSTTTRNLWVNNVRSVRASSTGPMSGSPTATLSGPAGYTFASNPLAAYARPTDLELVYLRSWRATRIAVASMNATTITMTTPDWTNAWTALPGGPGNNCDRYENAKELLTVAGQFYWNAGTNVIYYIPRLNEVLSSSTLVVGNLGTILDLTSCTNVAFTGIQFSHTTWMTNRPSIGWCAPYNKTVPAAAQLHGCTGCSFTSCSFKFLGSNGLNVDTACSTVTATGCMFADISAMAIVSGDVDGANGSNSPIMSNINYSNCYIVNVAVEFFAQAVLGQANNSNLTVSHCEVAYNPYSGISLIGQTFTGTWTGAVGQYYGVSRSIANCLVHDNIQTGNDTGQLDISEAQGAVGSESTLTNNVIYGGSSGGGTVEGIYYDDGVCAISTSGNIIHDIPGSELYVNNANHYDAKMAGNYLGAGTVTDLSGTVAMSPPANVVGSASFPAATLAAAGLQSTYLTIKQLANTVLRSDFAAANNTFITNYANEDGGDFWHMDQGDFQVTSNKLTSYLANAIAWRDSGVSDVQIDCNVQYSGQLSLLPCLLFRYSDYQNYYYAGLDANGVYVSIYQVVNGVTTKVASGLCDPYFQLFPKTVYPHRLKVTAVGSIIQVYIDEKLLVAYSGASFNQTATKHGLFTVGTANGTATVQFDHFLVTAISGSTPAAPTIYFDDHFVDVNSTLLTAHAPNVGTGSYVVPTGTFTILNDSCEPIVGANAVSKAYFANGGGVANNCTIYGTNFADLTATNSAAVLFFRMNANTSWWQLNMDSLNNAFDLTYYDGAYHNLATGSFTFLPGRAYELKAVLSGDLITAYIGGKQVAQVTNSFNDTQKGLGFETYFNSGGGTAQPNAPAWRTLRVTT